MVIFDYATSPGDMCNDTDHASQTDIGLVALKQNFRMVFDRRNDWETMQHC